MIERHFILDGIDPVGFYGAGNIHLQMLKKLHPKLRIVARDNIIKAMGDDDELERFGRVIDLLKEYCNNYNSLNEEAIIDAVNGKRGDKGSDSNVIVYNINGRPIYPRTENQCRLVEEYKKNDMVFAVGPAGTGKTYTAIALAVKALKNREIRKIILSRPAVEAGEKLGFLPGDMRDKIDPYLQPLYDALEDMIPMAKLKEHMDSNVIQIAPLAFMRGRTLNDAVVILDEAQNTTPQQIKMFLTRMGNNTKMIITGDLTQIDLPQSNTSGLMHAQRVLNGVPGIGFVTLTKKDIVRHKLVTRIVEAYEKHEKQVAERTKMNYKSSNEISLESYPLDNTSVFLEYDEYFYYSFAREDEVPEGFYHGLIVDARPSTNRYNDPCIDVFMKLIKYTDLQKWDKNMIDTFKYYHVKFRFKSGTDPYKQFSAEMHYLGIPPKAPLKDIIGIICTFKIFYTSGCPLGSIKDYCDYTLEPELFELSE